MTQTDDTRRSVLDAALTVLAERGVSKLALEDVANEAAVSRQTVYRHFGSREGLISAVILREEQRLIARMTRRARHPGLSTEDAIHAAIEEALIAAREHPLLDRLLASEPEALLPFLTMNHGPVLSAARPVVEELLHDRLPEVPRDQLAADADALTRLIVSYAISPGEDPPEVTASRLADLACRGLLR